MNQVGAQLSVAVDARGQRTEDVQYVDTPAAEEVGTWHLSVPPPFFPFEMPACLPDHKGGSSYCARLHT